MRALTAAACAALLAAAADAAVPADEIKKMPGWDAPLPSKQYSGYINVPEGPGGQNIFMHYNFIESQNSPASDPLTLWQQGGPGSSGFGFGYMAELGPFHLSAESMSNMTDEVPNLWQNPYSWDTLSNILILEHPPGTGFSYCAHQNGTPTECQWNDDTQAEAFLMELEGWFQLFPEYKDNDFYLTGESYAGLLLPNLMNQIATKPNAINLKAAAIGNGCTGTPGQSVKNPGSCNLGGGFDTQHNVDLFYGHGMLATKDYKKIYNDCAFDCGPTLAACHNFSKGDGAAACQKALSAMDKVGEYNIYNIYDTCGSGNMSTGAAGAADESLPEKATFSEHRSRLSEVAGLFGAPAPSSTQPADDVTLGTTGGPPYSWRCGMGDATSAWMNNEQVRKGINMKPASFYGRPWPYHGMQYDTYTHASIDLYPELLKKYRIVIYNGDADACVPYNGNEDWTVAMADKLGMTVIPGEDWRAWSVDEVPAGYVTVYDNPTGPSNFTFITIKEAGHMVPQYQPARALELFRRFLDGGTF